MTIIAKPEAILNVFRPEGIASLSDVQAQSLAGLEGTARRDLASAFTFLVERCGINLETTAATGPSVREVFETAQAMMQGASVKRLANVRSLVTRAVEQFGARRRRLTKGVPLDAVWAELLGRIERREYRTGLVRLATYCTAVGLTPQDVDADCLRSFHQALDEECLVKEPRPLLKHTIALWNMMGRTVPGWPDIILSSPFAVEAKTFALDEFPLSFQERVADYARRMSNPDPFDPDAPARALRPSTIKGDIVTLRRFASALVRLGRLPIEAVSGFDVFFENDNLKEGLRQFIKPALAGKAPDLRDCGRIARKLAIIAKHDLKLGEDAMRPIAKIVSGVSPKLPRTMGRRNRDRLDQFDDQKNVSLLLNFPRAEAARAMAKDSPIRRARGMERALAVSILINTGLRVLNLRSIHLDKNLRRFGDRAIVSFEPDEVKNSIALAHDLGAETIELLDLYLAHHRSCLPGSGGRFLFPGEDGGPLSYNAMTNSVATAVKKHTGITVSPHLYRHIIAKIIVDVNPELYVAVSHLLGHKSLNTTMQSYLGSQSRAAARTLSDIVQAARDAPPVAVAKQRRLPPVLAPSTGVLS